MTTQLTNNDKELLKIFFNEAFYLKKYHDLAENNIDGFEHFLQSGMSEGRNPSQIFDQNHISSTSSQGETWMMQTKKNKIAILREWPINSMFGPSVLVCPAWLAMQINAIESISLAELLETTIPAGSFAFHPGLLPCEVPEEITIAALIQQFDTSDVTKMSLLDLSFYTSNHKDLRKFKDSHYLAFNHLWSYGVLKNRLGYIGGKNDIDNPKDVQFLNHCETIYRHYFKYKDLTVTQSHKSLNPGNLEYASEDNPDLPNLHHLFQENHYTTTDNWTLSNINFLKSRISSNNVIVLFPNVDLENTDRVKMSEVGSQILTDQDLLSGAHRVTTRRVVYAVNIGDYDDLPIPPKMDDCSYFLITDSAEVPVDTPWTIVSPTLIEADTKRQCLWYKTHPHLLFPNAKFVTWIDSNIECGTLSWDILISHENLSELATFVHPDRNCLYKEAEAIVSMRLDSKKIIERVVKSYQSKGFPNNYGLYETNILFSRTQDMAVRRFFDTWWRNIYLGSRRDQISFTFSAWSEGVEISSLHSHSSTKNSRYFSKRAHITKIGRFV